MEGDTVAKFVSQKINKIRWQPTSKQVIRQSNVFATGSWDNDVNYVCIWSTEPPEGYQNLSDVTSVEPTYLEGEPRLLCEWEQAADITDLQFLNAEFILAGTSTGSFIVYKYHINSQTLSVHQEWEKLHHYGDKGCPCTGLATRGDDTVVTVGEDGQLTVLSLEQRTPVRTVENADSCALNGACFLKQFEVATVNATGQLKLWDLRDGSCEPARIIQLPGDQVALHCLDKHPSQPHIVATGGQDSTLTIWDMRQDKFPVTPLAAHNADIWEVKFHPNHPDNLFTCSEDGTVWHWDGSSMSGPTLVSQPPKSQANTPVSMSVSLTMPPVNTSKVDLNYSSPWLASDASKHRLNVTDILPGNVMPVNSIDIESNTLLCGSDGEQIFTVRNLAIR